MIDIFDYSDRLALIVTQMNDNAGSIYTGSGCIFDVSGDGKIGIVITCAHNFY
jgi:hypothetical protein